MASEEILELEATELREETEAQRLTNERRFSPPRGACPYGCDGSGWIELADDVAPEAMEIFWKKSWWTPCECNIRTRWIWEMGMWLSYPHCYPESYHGPRICSNIFLESQKERSE